MKLPAFASFLLLLTSRLAAAEPAPAERSPIPFDKLGAEAQQHYQGDDISITPTAAGASVRALLQDLTGEVTSEGLWLSSIADEDVGTSNRFRVRAMGIGRALSGDVRPLAISGEVRATKDAAVFSRPGLVEEYTVSVDGVRQDFLVLDRPAGHAGELQVVLEVTGARSEAASYGVHLTVDATGRELAYSRLEVTDANGRILPARFKADSAERLRVVVDDADAIYPVRIDPTFSDADWFGMGVGTSVSGVFSMVFDVNANLYVGGQFDTAGGVPANNVARWNGSAWSAVGNGVDGIVWDLTANGTNIFAVGMFQTASGKTVNNIARWNGTSWSALGGGLPGVDLSHVVIHDGLVYTGGAFTSSVWVWNGTSWSFLEDLADGGILTVAQGNASIYLGGGFTSVAGVPARGIAQWNGVNWSALGVGVHSVSAIAVDGPFVYVVGEFPDGSGGFDTHIARWNGSSWTTLGAPVDPNGAYQLAAAAGNLYVGGGFSSIDGVPANNLARWSGGAWTAIGSGVNGQVYSLDVRGSELYVAGSFSQAGGVAADGMAVWNNSTSRWSGVVSGLNDQVYGMAVSEGSLYVAGSFTSAGKIPANRVAKWNGSSWAALGSGLTDPTFAHANCVAASGGSVYVGGQFSFAGGVAAKNIAKWDGTSWSAMGSGTDDQVSSIAVSGNVVYAGGYFDHAGGVSVNHVAQWDGSAWSALGSGLEKSGPGEVLVLALTPAGSDLYVGGEFETAGGVSADCVAKWDGSNWSPLGTGIDAPFGEVRAIAVSGTDVYVAGRFSSAGGTAADNIARWNGSEWFPVGLGLRGEVWGLLTHGNDLYAAGYFDVEGVAHGLLRWNGDSWTNLATGINGTGTSLAMIGSNLYVGGAFTTAGGKPSYNAARARVTFPSAFFAGGIVLNATSISVQGSVNANGSAATVTLEYGTDISYGSSAAAVLSPNGGSTLVPVSKTVTGLTVGTTYHFRWKVKNAAGVSYSRDGTFFIPAGTIAFGLPPVSSIVVSESGGEVQIPIVRTGGTSGAIWATLNTANGTAVAPGDYTARVNLPVSMGDGVSALHVPIGIFDHVNTDEGNEYFTVNLSGSFVTPGGATSVTVRLIDTASDNTDPGVPSITAPASNALVPVAATSAVMITGIATDNKGVGVVKVSLNGGLAVDAILASPGAPSTKYTAMVGGTVGGANSTAVMSVDTQGNESSEVMRSFRVSRPLLVHVNATLGGVTPGYAPSSFREIGKSCAIAATAKSPVAASGFAGGLFTGWTLGGQDTAGGNAAFTPGRLGIATSALQRTNITFIYREGLELNANFVPNPFVSLAGTYHGLIRPSSSLTVRTNSTEGGFTAVVMSSGGFSGKLTIDGAVHRIAGAFDADGNARFGTTRSLTQVVARAGKPSIVVALSLNIAANQSNPAVDDKITGTITTTDFLQSVTTAECTVDSDRAVYDGATSIVPAAYLGANNANGIFTAVLPAKNVSQQTPGYTKLDFPQGSGIAFITITKAGTITVTGTLSDNSSFTVSTALSQIGATNANRFPLFVPMYGGKGFLSGFVQLDSTQASSDMAAMNLQWLRPTQPTATHYLYGWPDAIKVDLLAAKYVVTADQSVLKAPDGADAGSDGDPLGSTSESGNVALAISDGQLSETLNKSANVSIADGVTKVPFNDSTFALSINRKTGMVIGSFSHSDDSVPTYNAVILQKGPDAGAYGFFLTTPTVPIDFSGEAGGIILLGQP
jgi:hypothetical protein